MRSVKESSSAMTRAPRRKETLASCTQFACKCQRNLAHAGCCSGDSKDSPTDLVRSSRQSCLVESHPRHPGRREELHPNPEGRFHHVTLTDQTRRKSLEHVFQGQTAALSTKKGSVPP